ncbi:MAG: penicillin-binding protein 2 [Nostocaceae cyanobacterium]|nr:penicillin-binding protein 2 [Nostocaceae cyanobacterium]
MQKSQGRTNIKSFAQASVKRQQQPQKAKPPKLFSPPKPETANNRRLFLVWGALMTATCGLAINLYYLQIVRAPTLQSKARQQQMVSMRPFVPRRPVVDRNNNVLAMDRPVYVLFAHPKLFKKPAATIAEQLAPILDRQVDDLLKQFQRRKTGIQIAGGLPEQIADRIAPLRIDGLELIQQYSRFYPQQDLVADIVGYVNLDRRGQAGVEFSQEKILERSVQAVRLSRSGTGSLMPDHAPEGFLHFDDLRLELTIDIRLQRAARFALAQQIQKFRGKRGAVIVMDASNGAILALVSQPSYNPNEYYKADMSLFRNWAIADLYEPGSTFKPLNVAIALEAGAITPDTTFYDGGSIQVAGWPIRNAHNSSFGRMTITEILKHSSNVAMVQMMQRLKPNAYYGWLERMGLGQTMDTDLPFEAPSKVKSQEEFISSPIEPATAAFGQGLALTPLQLVELHAALANGGKLVTPHVVRGLVNTKGQLHWQPSRNTPRQIFSPSTAQTVVKMMEAVVTDGTGKASQIPGYRIAGKTGTSQKAGPRGGYLANAKITSFVGMIPAENPRYVVLAIVDEPQGNAFGSTVAAPIVKSVMESLISVEQIPPSHPEEVGKKKEDKE